MTRSLGAGVEAIEIRGPGIATRVLATSTRDKIRAAVAVSAETQIGHVAGRLTMGDFAPSALRCRIDTPTGSVVCDFEHDLRAQVLNAMDRFVHAEGLAEIVLPAGDARLLHIESLTIVDEQQAGELGASLLPRAQRRSGASKICVANRSMTSTSFLLRSLPYETTHDRSCPDRHGCLLLHLAGPTGGRAVRSARRRADRRPSASRP